MKEDTLKEVADALRNGTPDARREAARTLGSRNTERQNAARRLNRQFVQNPGRKPAPPETLPCTCGRGDSVAPAEHRTPCPRGRAARRHAKKAEGEPQEQAPDPIALPAPFPYFGGKRRIASLIWERVGNVANYVEPFAGSLAVLLCRPHSAGIETVNDNDALLSNFWRALQAAPQEVARYADYPVNEADLEARHTWLRQQAGAGLREQVKADPFYFDARAAGFWVWGVSAWIGSGWCDDAGQRRKLPELGSGAGRGVHRKSLTRYPDALPSYFDALARRLRRVRVACGDWRRVVTPSVTTKNGMTGVLLDPPYLRGERERGLYSEDSRDVLPDVLAWCLRHGDTPALRIALCLYDGDGIDALERRGWSVVRWESAGGYGVQGTGRGRENAKREAVAFSPHCLLSDRKTL